MKKKVESGKVKFLGFQLDTHQSYRVRNRRRAIFTWKGSVDFWLDWVGTGKQMVEEGSDFSVNGVRRVFGKLSI